MIDLNTIKDADLQHKIDNLKAERERTAETLKRYEAEMAERNRRVPLGVPLIMLDWSLKLGAILREIRKRG